MDGLLFLLFFVVALIVFLFVSAFRIVKEYERAVIFRLGRVLQDPKGPGWFLIIPFGIDQMVKVDLRVVTLDIPRQDCITNDNVTVGVNAVAYFRVVDPMRAVIQVDNYTKATFQIAQTSLRSVIGQVELDELLAHRERVNDDLQRIIDEQTEPWGIKVSIVEIKDVELPPQMQRAMARQAEAEREKRAKIIHAQGEFQAAEQLQQAARLISSQPSALQLRYLQTLTEIAVEKNSTIIFPLPIDMLNVFTDFLKQNTHRDNV
ncbi:MAG: slipin family protein [Anaerolineae bacterium]|nr:slipin family protein [Anaerolineae bacterium]